MYLHEESALGDIPLPIKPQLKDYSYSTAETDAAAAGQRGHVGRMEPGPETSGPRVRASLHNRDLWSKFREIGTEMVVTKSGRRMFPSCKVSVTDLNPKVKYVLLMDMVPFDDSKYKWNKDRWEVNGRAEPHLPNHFFIHPDSPATGDKWMQYPISFHKLKLTNNTLNSSGLVVLHSMHRYVPRLHVLRNPEPGEPHGGGNAQVMFPEAAFMAVTAYQNTEITRLKIDYNPFAKGFRDHGLNNKRYRANGNRGPCKRPVKGDVVIWNGPSGAVTSRHVSGTVNTGDGADFTVSSAGDSRGVECMQEGTVTSNPFISAFMNPGLADTTGSPEQKIQLLKHRNGPKVINRHPNTAALLSRCPILGQSFSKIMGRESFPQLPQNIFNQINRSTELQLSSGARTPPGQDLSAATQHAAARQEATQQAATQQAAMQHLSPDYPLALPPNIRRLQLSESALRSLEAASVLDASGPRPLADILNRVWGASGAGMGSTQKQAQVQATWPPLGSAREPLLLPHQEQTGERRPLQAVLGQQSSVASLGLDPQLQSTGMDYA